MEIIKIKNKEAAIKRAAIEKAIAVLKKGGLIIYPTETCYGIGANATNLAAVKKVLEFKGSRGGKAISIAVDGRKMAEKYVEINDTAENFYQQFLPGPLTVVSKSKGRVVKSLEVGRGTLGIRIPNYRLVLDLIRALGKPITSTSANTSGKKTPYCLRDVLKYTTKKRLDLVELFLDVGRLPYNPPSTVVDTTLNETKVLRQGEIKIKAIPQNIFLSESETATKDIAKNIFEKYRNLLKKRALIFALQGELGSGKTQFAKGLALALKIKDNVVSPTFNVIREYPFKLSSPRPGLCKFYHLDTWRLESGEELLDFGFLRMLKPGNVIAIEWVQKMSAIIKNIEKRDGIYIVWVNIEHVSETKRKISYQIDK